MNEIDKTISALKQNGFDAHFVKTGEDARNLVLKLIPNGVTVGAGGSMTLEQTGIIKALLGRGQKLIFHWKPNISAEEKHDLRRQALFSDIYLASANAITESGELVNVDGYGNRVAAMVFGPKQVIIVAGKNKLVKDIAAALNRIKQIAAPKNAGRMNLNTPCAATGKCTDCDSPARICRITTIISKKPAATPITVILVGEELGF